MAAALPPLVCGAWMLAVHLVPFPEEKLLHHPAGVVLTDRHGTPLRVRLGAGDQDCRPGYRPEQDHWIAKAMVAAEDKRFWEHRGLDWLALGRAVGQNVWFARRISGASTISTQVIRLMEPRPRTPGTKLIEAFRAMQLERRLEKQDILAQYLDRAPFGGNLVGIEAAAQRYFGKAAADLSLAEAAILAGVPQSPARGRPDRHWQRAKRRQGYVLDRMAACGYITEAQADAAWREPLSPELKPYPFRAPHFCDLAGVPAAPAADSTVRTTLDAGLQQTAERILALHLNAKGIDGGAVVILETATGAIRALAGSPDYDAPAAGQVNGAIAARAAGSTLKPFVYAMAMDAGFFTPGSLLRDAPRRFADYDPKNFSLDFRGAVNLREALVLSLNLPAIQVEERIGLEKFHATLRRLGLHTLNKPAAHYGLGLVLGNAEVRLLDLANAYACFAREGVWMPPRFVEAADGASVRRQTLFSAEAAWLISDMLGGEERAMDTTGHAVDVRLPPMAWKTGTSAGLRDAWTVAWNPDYVVGVWAGHVDGRPNAELVGRVTATPIAWDVFRHLYPDNNGPWFAKPADVQPRAVCSISGFLPSENCHRHSEDWAIARISRRDLCPGHPSAMAKADKKPVAVAAGAPKPREPLRIVSPSRQSAYRLLPEMEGLSQRIPLQASGFDADEPLYWFVNDQPVGTAKGGEPLLWPLVRGQHQIACSTPKGLSDCIQIAVE